MPINRGGEIINSLTILKDINDCKEECLKLIKNHAINAAANAINPIPGLDVSIDIGICLKMMADIRQEFGLDSSQEYILRKYDILIPLVDKVFSFTTKEGVIILLKEVSTKYFSKSAIKYVPFIGQIIAAISGYSLVILLGKAYINDCYELAKRYQQIKTIDL